MSVKGKLEMLAQRQAERALRYPNTVDGVAAHLLHQVKGYAAAAEEQETVYPFGSVLIDAAPADVAGKSKPLVEVAKFAGWLVLAYVCLVLVMVG